MSSSGLHYQHLIRTDFIQVCFGHIFIIFKPSSGHINVTLRILFNKFPDHFITGFTRPSEAIEYARANRIALAFLDVEMGKINGLELCKILLEINPRTNVVYLTAYSDYAVDAWGTGASGFMLKPITPEGVLFQLKNLRYPFFMGGAGK